MLTFNEACKIAYEYYSKRGVHGLKVANDLGDEYAFMGNIETTYYGGDICPIIISKKTGQVGGFAFYLPENIKALDNSTKMTIPDEFGS